MAKVDLKSAFRMVPVHPTDWHLLGLRDNYYIDTCLPFGLQSAPFLFNEIAAAMPHGWPPRSPRLWPTSR